ncbi:MAG TPA: methyltransferase domain-containing protein [Longimicrobiales bacterium]
MLRRLEHSPELLDAPQHDPAELEQSLDHVAEVNRLLGGTRAVLRTLADVSAARSPLAILDVATGSADIPIAIAERAHRHGTAVHITATDAHPQMRAIAADRTRAYANIRVEPADALQLPYADASFDVVLLSLALHHFERAAQQRALREAARVARDAVIINELERCLPNYLGARLLAATRWRSNRLTRHDGPLSVLRAFTADELRHVTEEAGLRVLSLRRHFFHRLVLVAAGEA